ncbi:hypothetical protein [Amorphus sp. 3PC139-8]|uniref:hypothetical protein n=1 Tax=Amorphus sp. 3PC139-8 TaxID=2735676 RepID=UPI00345DE1EB
MSSALTPDGKRIVGVVEEIVGTARLGEDSFSREANGELGFSYAGETEIDWNSQKPVRPSDGKGRIFVDEDGEFWRETEIVLEEEPKHTTQSREDDGPSP